MGSLNLLMFKPQSLVYFFIHQLYNDRFAFDALKNNKEAGDPLRKLSAFEEQFFNSVLLNCKSVP